MPLSPSSPAAEAVPTLTVVVALPSPGATRGMDRLEAWAGQLVEQDELRPVTSDPEVSACLQRRGLPALLCRGAAGVPELWAHGMHSAAGTWVVTTLGDLEPAPGLLGRLRALLREGAVGSQALAAVGGRITPPAPGSAATLRDLYVLRYGAHLRPAPAADVEELAADLAAYRREGLERHREAWVGGFWEPESHRRFLAEGGRLLWRPELEARLADGPSCREFLAQRFRHGRRYGADRLRGAGRLVRLLRLASVPVIAPLFVLRALRRLGPVALANPRQWTPLPWVFAFATAWALGEGRGYLSPLPETTGDEGR